MDDDVVPAPDCLGVLMAVDEDCLMAVREDTAGRLVEKAAVRFDLRNPLRIKPKTAMVETTYGDPRRDAGAGRARERRVRGLHGPPARSSRRSACPTRRSSSSTTTSTTRSAPGAPGSGSGRSATRSWSASSTSTSSTTCRGGRATTCTATCSPCTAVRREPAVRAKPWLIAAGVVALSPLRGGQDEVRNVSRALRDYGGTPGGRDARAGHPGGPAAAGPGDLDAGVAGPDVRALGRRPGGGGAVPAGRRPAGRARGPHLRRVWCRSGWSA